MDRTPAANCDAVAEPWSICRLQASGLLESTDRARDTICPPRYPGRWDRRPHRTPGVRGLILDKGVSWALAELCAQPLSDLHFTYRLRMPPALETPIEGTLVAEFQWSDIRENDLVLDFKHPAGRVGEVRVSGASVAWEATYTTWSSRPARWPPEWKIGSTLRGLTTEAVEQNRQRVLECLTSGAGGGVPAHG